MLPVEYCLTDAAGSGGLVLHDDDDDGCLLHPNCYHSPHESLLGCVVAVVDEEEKVCTLVERPTRLDLRENRDAEIRQEIS